MEQVIVSVEDGKVYLAASPMDRVRLAGLLAVAQAMATGPGPDRVILELSPAEAEMILAQRRGKAT